MVVAYDKSTGRERAALLPKWSTTGSDWRNKPAVDGEGLGENFLELHSIGRTTTKYMAMPDVALGLATGLGQEDYCEKPFADLHDNREFATEYKAAGKGRPLRNLALKQSTQYARDFQGPTQSQLARVRPDKAVAEDPEDNSFRTLGGKGPSLFTASRTQDDFGSTSCKLPARSFHHETSIAPLGSSAKSWRTTYSREHAPRPMTDKQTSTVPVAFKGRRRQRGVAALGGRPGRMSPEAVGALVEASRHAVHRSFSAPSQLGVLDRPF